MPLQLGTWLKYNQQMNYLCTFVSNKTILIVNALVNKMNYYLYDIIHKNTNVKYVTEVHLFIFR